MAEEYNILFHVAIVVKPRGGRYVLYQQGYNLSGTMDNWRAELRQTVDYWGKSLVERLIRFKTPILYEERVDILESPNLTCRMRVNMSGSGVCFGDGKSLADLFGEFRQRYPDGRRLRIALLFSV